jgi:hypothetical protein
MKSLIAIIALSLFFTVSAATADSRESVRPRLTLAPLSNAIGIQIQQPFDDDAVKDLARWLEEGKSGRTILIAWHHGKLSKLLERLGANPSDMLPEGRWPEDVYDWVVVLRYDHDGELMPASSRLVQEPALVK